MNNVLLSLSNLKISKKVYSNIYMNNVCYMDIAKLVFMEIEGL